MRLFGVLSASLLLLSACAGGAGDETDARGEVDRDPDGEALQPVTGGEREGEADLATATGCAGDRRASPWYVVGHWVSPSCGERSYPRVIQLDSNGRFAAQDLVAPCPKDVVCFWSGIIFYQGAYQVDARGIRLKVEGSDRGFAGALFPARLLIDPATSAPIELTLEGVRCPYVRAGQPPTMPNQSR